MAGQDSDGNVDPPGSMTPEPDELDAGDFDQWPDLGEGAAGNGGTGAFDHGPGGSGDPFRPWFMDGEPGSPWFIE